VETSHPGNIGAAARAMKAMGLERLSLVRPARFPCAEATARASGADDILAAAQVCASLPEALTEATLVAGASARLRSIPWPALGPAECAGRLLRAAAGAEVALVFGNEQSGLSNRDLERCNHLVHIPTNPAFSSLNLAAAVQVLAYELRRQWLGEGQAPPGEGGEALATAAQVARFHEHLERVLSQLGVLDPRAPRQLMRRMRRLFNRVTLERTEVNLLRGILSAVEKGGRGAGPGR
jgi:tRNA (cytidine32/uridine32-2'-O)-methyltransferase